MLQVCLPQLIAPLHLVRGLQVRHLANVFQGLLMSSPEIINTPAKWAKLWLHESERVYADRLVSQAVSTSCDLGAAWLLWSIFMQGFKGPLASIRMVLHRGPGLCSLYGCCCLCCTG